MTPAAVLSALPDGVLVVTADDRITLANPAATRLLGTGVVGCPLTRVLSIEPGWRAGGRWRAEAVGRPLDLHVTPAADATIMVLRDASALDASIAAVVHEVRAPLAAVIGALALLGMHELPVEAKRLGDLAQESSAHLLRLVDDLLDLGRGLTIAPQPIDLRDVLAAAGNGAEGLALSLGVAVIVEGGAVPVRVDGDPVRLRQVLANLLDNALRLAPPGSRVRLRSGIEDGRAVVRVEDRGPGIPPGQQERVFARFASFRAGGTGLGLAIAQEIVQRHDGTIGYRARPGGGACFAITLPLID